MKKEKVYAVTVTYADRYKFLKEVIEGVLKAGVDKLVIVNNGAYTESKAKIEKIRQKYKNKIIVLSTGKNTGSAIGFSTGLKYCHNTKECDFIWTMDDDNVPEKNALDELKKFWKNNTPPKGTNKINKLALFSMRYYDIDFRLKTSEQLKIGNIEKDKLFPSSFAYFSIQRLLAMPFNVEKQNKKPNNKKYYEIVCGPYGGFFCHKSLLDTAGYPKEEFFTYCDDLEFTYRMSKKHNVKLYLISTSELNDVDMNLPNPKIKTYFAIFKTLQNIHEINNIKLYYSHRNRVFFEKHYLIKNKFNYTLSRWTYNCIIYPALFIAYFLIYNDIKKIRLLGEAISDGYHERLDKKPEEIIKK